MHEERELEGRAEGEFALPGEEGWELASEHQIRTG